MTWASDPIYHRVDITDVRCECCGSNPPRELVFDRDGMTALCGLCDGLIGAGLVRPDGQRPDGTRLYRHWRPEWTPGDLVRA